MSSARSAPRTAEDGSEANSCSCAKFAPPMPHANTVTLSALRRAAAATAPAFAVSVGNKQRDLGRVRACLVGEELPCQVEAGRDHGAPGRNQLVDARVNLDRIGRDIHAELRPRVEGDHAEARRVDAEGVLAHLWLGVGEEA